MTVKELIIKLLDYKMDSEVSLSIDEPHQDEHGKIEGYVFDIDSIEYEYGAVMIKFNDYRSDKKQVCEEGDKLVEWIKFENRITELEKTITNIQSVVLDLLKEGEKKTANRSKKTVSRPKKKDNDDYPFDPNVPEMGQL